MRKSIAEEIYEGVKQKILDGELQPGDRIIEKALQEEYEASNSPVREAIRLLSSAGIVEIIFNKGAIVVDYSDEKKMLEIFEARYAIESYCAISLAKRGNPEKLKILEEATKCLEDVISQKDATQFEIFSTDEEFHNTLVKLSDNQELYNLFSNLHLFQKSTFNTTFLSSGKRQFNSSLAHYTAENHRQIFEAIKKKDFAEIEKNLSQHFAVKQIESVLHNNEKTTDD